MKIVILARVSTKMQSDEGVSLQEQVETSTEFCEKSGHEVIAVFREVGSGAARHRPVLDEAIELCKKTGAALVVKSLSRLSRRVALIAKMMEEKIEFVVVELGSSLCPFQIHIYAAFAEMERRRISERVIAGMRQAKKNGVKFGNPNAADAAKKGRAVITERSKRYIADMMKIIEEIRAAGVTTKSGIARALNARGIKTNRGNAFSGATVLYILRKHETMKRAA